MRIADPTYRSCCLALPFYPVASCMDLKRSRWEVGGYPADCDPAGGETWNKLIAHACAISSQEPGRGKRDHLLSIHRMATTRVCACWAGCNRAHRLKALPVLEPAKLHLGGHRTCAYLHMHTYLEWFLLRIEDSMAWAKDMIGCLA